MAKILFLSSGSPANASARFRMWQFLPYFERGGIQVVDVITVNTAMSLRNIARILLLTIKKAWASDILFIQKARLPGSFLRILGLFCKIVYDFDDAVFLPPPTWPAGKDFAPRQRRLNATLRRADAVIAGNDYLAGYARGFAREVIVIPTVVDAGQSHPDSAVLGVRPFSRQVFEPANGRPGDVVGAAALVVGWIGHPSHVELLDAVGPALRSLQEKHGIRVKVVSTRQWAFPGLEVINKEWSLEEEVSDVQSFDIGLMPLDVTDPFLKGKCGFKIIEYMAVGAPPVASAVGVNTEIIQQGRSGFAVSDQEEWAGCLTKLVQDPALRREMAAAARQRVLDAYSIDTVLPKYLALFERLAR